VDNRWDARRSVAGACARAVSQRALAVPPSADRSLRHWDGRAVWSRGLRGFSATTSSRTNGRRGTPVCAATRGPVRAAA